MNHDDEPWWDAGEPPHLFFVAVLAVVLAGAVVAVVLKLAGVFE